MESIYYVMSWACHRRCKHCYEERFRPYVREELEGVVREAEANFPRIVANLPPRMTYRDRSAPLPGGGFAEKRGRIIVSGGETLLDPVRERVTYKVIAALVARYRDVGGVNVVVQTTGDLLDDAIVADLRALGVWMISVAGVDDFHVGMEGPEKQRAFMTRVGALLERHGFSLAGAAPQTRSWLEEEGPLYSFFGATPDTWIGKLWPRGRAWSNGLSTATLADNFCNRWSGGVNFLEHGWSGAEVSIEPTGDVYPCCVKTKLPIGNLTEEGLIEILDSLRGDPVYEAINRGEPERMGLVDGWSAELFREKSATIAPDGSRYQNLCIGCDRFHEEVLGPRIAAARAQRRARRGAAA
jgi:hypothetical protein